MEPFLKACKENKFKLWIGTKIHWDQNYLSAGVVFKDNETDDTMYNEILHHLSCIHGVKINAALSGGSKYIPAEKTINKAYVREYKEWYDKRNTLIELAKEMNATVVIPKPNEDWFDQGVGRYDYSDMKIEFVVYITSPLYCALC